MEQNKNITISDIPEIFPEGYSIACIKGRKPVIIDDEKERDEHILDILNNIYPGIDNSNIDLTPFYMKFPKETITTESGAVIDPHIYVAKITSTSYIYPGLIKIQNSPIGLKYAPCTFQTPKVGMPGSNYQKYISGKETGPDMKKKTQTIGSSTNVIKNATDFAKFGQIPPLLQTISLHSKKKYLKTGIPFSPRSVLWCLEYAIGNNPMTEKNIIDVRNKIYNTENIKTKIRQQTANYVYQDMDFVDPKKMIKVLEDFYKVHIHIVSDYKNKTGMFELPYSKSVYYKNFKYKHHVILFKHESTQHTSNVEKSSRRTIFLEYTHYELVGIQCQENKFGMVSLISTDIKDKNNPNMIYDTVLIQNIMDIYKYFYADKMVIYNDFDLVGCKKTGQYIDTYGNARGICVKLDDSDIECFFYFLHPSEPYSDLPEHKKGANIDGTKIYINVDTLHKLLNCIGCTKLKNIVREINTDKQQTIGVTLEVNTRMIYIPNIVISEDDIMKEIFKDVEKITHIQEKDFFVEIDQVSSFDLYNKRQNAVTQFVNNVYRMFSLHTRYEQDGVKVDKNWITNNIKSFFLKYVIFTNPRYKYNSETNEFEGMIDKGKILMSKNISKKIIQNILMKFNIDPDFFKFPHSPRMFYRNVKNLYRKQDNCIIMVGDMVFNYWLQNRDVEFKYTIHDNFTDDYIQFMYIKDLDGIERRYIVRKYILGKLGDGNTFIGNELEEGGVESLEDAENRVIYEISKYINTYFKKIKSSDINIKRHTIDLNTNKLNLCDGYTPKNGVEVDIVYINRYGISYAYWIDNI